MELWPSGTNRAQKLAYDRVESVHFSPGDFHGFLKFGSVRAVSFSRFAFDQLQMNVERVQWVANLVGNAGGEQSERVEPLRFNRLLFSPAAFRDIAQNNCMPDLRAGDRSEEHTSELQSRENLVCRLLLE